MCQGSCAVASPPEAESTPKQRRKKQRADAAKPKQHPPYAVVLFNDEEHSFPYVIETLMKVLGYPQEKSYSLTLQIHNSGRGIVWSGSREVAELKRDQIRSAGPDFYAVKKVEFHGRAIGRWRPWAINCNDPGPYNDPGQSLFPGNPVQPIQPKAANCARIIHRQCWSPLA